MAATTTTPLADSTARSRRCGDPADLSGFSILVTDEHYKHTLGLVRHLGTRGARVSILAISPFSPVCSSRYCRAALPLADKSIDAFLAGALDAVSSDSFDLMMPVSYPKTLALARHISDFLPYVKIELADARQIELAANKTCMGKLAVRVGVAAPQSAVPHTLEEVERLAKELKYPVVVKPQRESAGRSVSYARNSDELESLCAPFFTGLPGNAEPPLLQEFIPGYGCGFFATYQHGVCKRIFMHRRVREYPASGGVSTCAQSFYDPKLAACGRKVLDALHWHGVAMVEFRHDSRDNEFKLIEVNPKFWGSLDLALAAGADFPGDLCRMADGQQLTFTDAYDRDLRFHWPFSISGELYHLKSRPQSLFEVTGDFLSPRVKSNVWPSDPLPNLRELAMLGRYLVSPKSRRGE
ncbi:MAG TPA: hypothetical protein VKF79_00910 [Candidatus Acidoferrum sp.]|nr:hypothetical protein [Candidatus Acidoferrum sp.]